MDELQGWPGAHYREGAIYLVKQIEILFDISEFITLFITDDCSPLPIPGCQFEDVFRFLGARSGSAIGGFGRTVRHEQPRLSEPRY